MWKGGRKKGRRWKEKHGLNEFVACYVSKFQVPKEKGRREEGKSWNMVWMTLSHAVFLILDFAPKGRKGNAEGGGRKG